MSNVFLVHKQTTKKINNHLEDLLIRASPDAVGASTAFLSLDGARAYEKILKSSKVKDSKIIAGLSGYVTNPNALRYLLEKGHSLKLGVSDEGIFHPKLIVGGSEIFNNGKIMNPNCAYIGSANFTRSGFTLNTEVMLATSDETLANKLSLPFTELWSTSTSPTDLILREYEKEFSKRQRTRGVKDLEFLDVVTKNSESQKPNRIYDSSYASAAWTGLESFTGEHTFQVEFPKKAGEALSSILGTKSGDVDIDCVDGETRLMGFRYYQENGMYRLNVPNDVPLVKWARNTKKGALLVWKDDCGNPRIKAEIIRGQKLEDVVLRSEMIGTLGETSTRSFGWY